MNLDKCEILADESIGNEPEKNHDSGAASIKQPVGGAAANRDERIAGMLPSLLSPTVRLPLNVLYWYLSFDLKNEALTSSYVFPLFDQN